MYIYIYIFFCFFRKHSKTSRRMHATLRVSFCKCAGSIGYNEKERQKEKQGEGKGGKKTKSQTRRVRTRNRSHGGCSWPVGNTTNIFKSINKGSPWLNNPEIIEMLGFGPSHNKTEILLDPKLIQIIPLSF